MSSEHNLRENLGRKLTKRKTNLPRRSMDIPERLKYGDDVDDDVTAPKRSETRYMNQPIFQVISQAGVASKEREKTESILDNASSEDEQVTQSLHLPRLRGKEDVQLDSSPSEKAKKHKKRLSEHKLFRSIPRLRVGSSKTKKHLEEEDVMSSSQILPPRPSTDTIKKVPPTAATHKTHAVRSPVETDSGSDQDTDRNRRESITFGSKLSQPAKLAQRLKQVFEFETVEDVISEFPCYLLQTVLLSGTMYITQKHICFYAYLPKKINEVSKSGYLAKRGRQTLSYNRYWFVLKGDVLSYYTDPNEPYFRSGSIDLKNGISATLVEKDRSKELTSFSIELHDRTHHFKADSASSAKAWVYALQKVIFRSRNEGDSVKICLPINNVIDIEENASLGYADTVKLRVLESDGDFSVDEYSFSFFTFGEEARNILTILVEGNGMQKPGSQPNSPRIEKSPPLSPRHTKRRSQSAKPISAAHLDINTQSIPPLEHVRSTLSPISPGGIPRRVSYESRRSSFEVSRRSMELSREIQRFGSRDRSGKSISRSRSRAARQRGDKFPLTLKAHGSPDSPTTSVDRETEFSAVVQSLDESGGSASQILHRSDLFYAPTIKDLERGRKPPAADPVSKWEEELRSFGEQSFRQASTVEEKTNEATHDTPEQKDGVPPRLHQIGRKDSSTVQDLVAAGAYPLTKAADLAGYLKDNTRRMSTMLATESMGYFEKVSGMWAGGRKHYGTADGLAPDDQIMDPDDEANEATHGDRFRSHFALPETETLHATFFGSLQRVLPLYGKIYISTKYFCFRSLLIGTRTKLVLPLIDIENVTKEKGFRPGYCGMVVTIRGHEELFFEFSRTSVRDDCTITVLRGLDIIEKMEESGLLSKEEKLQADIARAENRMLEEARLGEQYPDEETGVMQPVAKSDTIFFDDPHASIVDFHPQESMRITCLTIGSRGDVQPYIALCKRLLADGHKPRIATHAEFQPWIEKHGIEFALVDGDPAELMRICVENGMFTVNFMKEATSKFRGWIDELLSSSWRACQGSDLLIESPSAMGGIHIAEALQIPYFRAFTMPWTRTRAYPHAFLGSERRMGGFWNYSTYILFDNFFWQAISGQVNRWRNKELALPDTTLDKMQPNKVPFLYNFSPSVVAPPLDYSDWIRITGYWFLDEGTDWAPDEVLTSFITRARADGKKLVYIGFGSIVVEDPAALTQTVVDSVLKADVCCILSKGWSDRLGKKDANAPEIPLPPDILQIKSAPHDWLFKQIDAAVHHGGAGTTGASLRAGIPTIIKPFFGDQFFFGSRVENLGVGICMKKLNTSVFARAIWEATHSGRMIAKARILGEKIRSEDGVGVAVQTIWRDLEYARTLVRKKAKAGEHAAAEELEEGEESWTFVRGDEGEDVVRMGRAEHGWEEAQLSGQRSRSTGAGTEVSGA